MIKLLLNHIEEKKNTYLGIMINNKNSVMMDILYDVIDKTLTEQISEDNHSSKVPTGVISKFYIGGVLNVCTEWLKNSNKYSFLYPIFFFIDGIGLSKVTSLYTLIPSALHNSRYLSSQDNL